MTITPIAPDEIADAVRIFLDAFAENVRLVYGDPPRPDAMHDVWSFVRSREPGGFLAAREGGGLAGYAIITSSVRKLQRSALTHGAVLAWVVRALSGRYGIAWRNVGRVMWNKLLFVGSARRFRTEGDAQLLNIAVAREQRGIGIAKALTRAGLDYLATRGVREVRLEVRPDNAAAIAAYRANGFVERGKTRDAGGEWLVMTAQP